MVRTPRRLTREAQTALSPRQWEGATPVVAAMAVDTATQSGNTTQQQTVAQTAMATAAVDDTPERGKPR
eukprot:645999-Lingulodinium_polyedra.AAC.1